MRNKYFFIIGCGRSGTSILGTLISQNPEVLYLREPRDLWRKAYPQTDIWSKDAKTIGSKLVWTENDIDTTKSNILLDSFDQMLKQQNKNILMEKLPINTFRLSFIDKIFPDARYIHIFRNGLEVAKSIEERCINGKWFGKEKYKLIKLIEYAKSKEETEYIPDICESYFDKGLMEWRLSIESTVDFLKKIDKSRYMEISYSALTNHTNESIERIFAFIGLEIPNEIFQFAKENIKPKSYSPDRFIINEKTLKIGGPLLSYFLNSENTKKNTVFQ